MYNLSNLESLKVEPNALQNISAGKDAATGESLCAEDAESQLKHFLLAQSVVVGWEVVNDLSKVRTKNGQSRSCAVNPADFETQFLRSMRSRHF
jgi:hypothetical protein